MYSERIKAKNIHTIKVWMDESLTLDLLKTVWLGCPKASVKKLSCLAHLYMPTHGFNQTRANTKQIGFIPHF
ncbi:hypothetical protein HZS_518 [Henneguya salminicola]|nr:hypothetical protein HZS_518 [Henneguya salminicola]